MPKWNKPETAPRNGHLVFANLGWPWPITACWNEYEHRWVYAMAQLNIVDRQEDPYFENEYAEDSELLGWLPLPDVNEVKK